MKAVLTYLIEHPSVLVAILTILYTAISTLKATRDLRQGLLALMLRAEKAWTNGEFGPVEGHVVMDIVVEQALTKLVPLLPAIVRPFITRDRIIVLATFLYDKANDYLDDGSFNDSVKARVLNKK